jgi:Na+-driven multidrug efflux pump
LESFIGKGTVTTKRWSDRVFSDNEYYRLFRLGIPIALQQRSCLLNMVAVVDWTAGAASVAVPGWLIRFFPAEYPYLRSTSGSAIFTAQLGKRHPEHRKVLPCLTMGLSAATFFLLVSELFPTQVLGIYSNDPQVIAIGSEYLRILALTFILFAITFCFSAVLRSTGDVRTPLLVTIMALSLNTFLSYVLIFGKFGLPAWNGAGSILYPVY